MICPGLSTPALSCSHSWWRPPPPPECPSAPPLTWSWSNVSIDILIKSTIIHHHYSCTCPAWGGRRKGGIWHYYGAGDGGSPCVRVWRCRTSETQTGAAGPKLLWRGGPCLCHPQMLGNGPRTAWTYVLRHIWYENINGCLIRHEVHIFVKEKVLRDESVQDIHRLSINLWKWKILKSILKIIDPMKTEKS